MDEVTVDAIREAAAALEPVARRTQLLRSFAFGRTAGAEVYLKPENLQRTGSFKVRGAFNKIRSLSEDERRRGVIASSAGNHAQGVASAAEAAGIPATIVMPLNAPLTKVLRTRRYGAEVVLAGEYYEAAYERAREIQAERGLTFVHPFDDPHVIAGQGTIGLEIFEDLPDVDTVLVPIGGGGLISGIAIALKALKPDVRVVGVQAAGAPSALKALEVGKLVSLDQAETIADGIKVRRIGELTFGYISRFVDEIVLADDEEIGLAMVELMERSKLVVEGAGAVTVAALLNGRLANPGRKVCAVLGGGNVDINLVASVIQRGLVRAGRYAMLHVRLVDQPGQLTRVLDVLAERRVNILDIEHYRAAWRVPIGTVDVEMLLEVRDGAHAREITQLLRADGFDAKLLNQHP
jgi:threonine dehydratase